MTAPLKKAAAVVLVSRSEDGTVTICDANGKSRVCSTMSDYGTALNQILNDPDLPEFHDVAPEQAHVEEVVVAGVKEAVPPFLRPFVRPGLQTMGSWLSTLSAVRRPPRTRSRRRRGRATTQRTGRAA